MDVNTLYLIQKYAIKKNQNGNLKPDDFNRVNNIAQREWVAFLCGNMEGYQPGHPLPRAEFGNNRTSRQRLSPVIYGFILNINSIYGYGTAGYPNDYIQTDAMYSIYGMSSIRYVPQHKLSTVYNSTIDPIDTNPIYLIKDKGFQFYPETQWQAKLSYVRNPPDIKWAYTVDDNGREVYDPNNSVDPIWDEVSMMEIIVRSLRIIGVNLQIGAVIQFAQEVKNTGQ